MEHWKEVARRKYLDLIAESAASRGSYREIVDRISGLVRARDLKLDFIKSSENARSMTRPNSTEEANAFEGGISAARDVVASLNHEIERTEAKKRSIESASDVNRRLAFEAKALLKKLCVITPEEAAA